MPIQIICATPGPTTTDRILDLILAHPQGITIKEMSRQLNRPVSMVQHCLKVLLASQQVYIGLSDTGMQQVCYPGLITFAVSQSGNSIKKLDDYTHSQNLLRN